METGIAAAVAPVDSKQEDAMAAESADRELNEYRDHMVSELERLDSRIASLESQLSAAQTQRSSRVAAVETIDSASQQKSAQSI
jgi:chromosome segregation ATPase